MEYRIGGMLLMLLIAGGVVLYANPTMRKDGLKGDGAITGERYKEIAMPAGFVNSDGIAIGDLVGKKVILIDFLTYSCINCQRTFPYVNAWYEAYKDQGLEIIGIHTPEFAFEKNIENVRDAMKQFGIMHPIVLDNDYATWRAFGNQYWPRKYLIDIHGNIVYDHIGEGAYEETEQKIRELLAERAQVLGEAQKNVPASLAADTILTQKNTARSPETYFGSLRNERFANGVAGQSGLQTLSLPQELRANMLYLGGVWDIQPEHAEAMKESVVQFRYTAGEVYLVAESDVGAIIEVFQDGVLVHDAMGEDVTREGTLSVQESRLYKLIKNTKAGEHTLELRVRGKGARLFAFTFG